MSKQARVEINDSDFIELIRNSGLFDIDWYLARNPDVASASVDPIVHWYFAAKTECRDPNFLFSTRWYLEANPDVGESALNPLVHYVLFGEREGRKPSVYFDPHWYAAQDGVVTEEHKSATWLAHYLARGRDPGLSPNRFFSTAYYMENNPDVVQSGLRPYEHFLSRGVFEGRDPSPSFSIKFYRKRFRLGADVDVFTYHLTTGEARGHATHPEAEQTVFSELAAWTSQGSFFKSIDMIPAGAAEDRGTDVFAFYLPQFHPVEVNDYAWGEGFTEWRNVPRGIPRFRGHHQPRVPRDLGYYDLRAPEAIAEQCRLAERAGLRGFGMYYYNFDGERVLDLPIDLFMEADTSLRFFLIWANENWTRTWDGFDREVIKQQDFDVSKIDVIAADIARHVVHERYYSLDGRPLLVIYRPGIIPDAREYLAALRQRIVEKSGRDPLIFMVQGFGDVNPRDYGLDGAMEFPPHKLGEHLPTANDSVSFYDAGYSGLVYRYDDFVERSLAQPNVDYPIIRTVFPSWDNEARRPGRGTVIHGSTPDKYEDWLSKIIGRAKGERIAGRAVVAINAWNEWCEGAYLEPDVHYGAAYLCSTAEAILGRKATSQLSVLLVGHDAYKHGAQLLLLNIARQMRRLGHRVSVILLRGGHLLDQYREACDRVHVCETHGELRRALDQERGHVIDFALTNTVVTGRTLPDIRQLGVPVVSLVHELPSLIRERGLEHNCREIARHASRVVFASPTVQKGFCEIVGQPVPTARILPQGIYQSIGLAAREPRGADAPLIINLGFGDLRKGYDLFVAVANHAWRSGVPARFLWLGDVDGGLRDWIRPEGENFERLPFTPDVSGFLRAANLLFLSSREDPFPSVALEASMVGIPVVAFEGTGGIADFLAQNGTCGSAIPMGSPAEVLERLLAEIRADDADKAAQRQSQMLAQFRFAPYVADLIALAVGERSSVTAVIPNYNYAGYIERRMRTVTDQTLRPVDVVVLDDCSKDESLDVINRVARRHGSWVTVIPNATNSGSPFRQWEKGVALATGKYTWIAEADDECTPDFLETMVRFADQYECDICFCDSIQVDENDRKLADSYRYYFDTINPDLFESSFVMDGSIFLDQVIGQKNVILNVSSVLWKTEALRSTIASLSKELQGFKVAGDWRIYADVCSKAGARIGYVSESLNVHRRHMGSATHTQKRTEQLQEIARLHKTIGSLLGRRTKELEVRQASYIQELKKQFALS